MKSNQPTRLQRILKSIYDKDEKAIFGRTAKSWGLIFIFYVIAYTLLAAFFTGMLSVFLFGYLNNDVPNLTGMQSLLTLKPGVNFSPRLSVIHTFIQLTAFPSSLNAPYLEQTRILFDKYESTENNTDCTGGTTGSDFPDTPCRFPISTLGACSDPQAALNSGNPCIYLRLNRIFGWLPRLSNVSEFQNAVIYCKGQNPIDDFMLQKPKYFPEYTGADGSTYGAIPNTYFPWLKQPGYQTPIVAVQFPSVRKDTVIMVDCFVLGLQDNDSGVSFEFVLDSRTTPAE